MRRGVRAPPRDQFLDEIRSYQARRAKLRDLCNADRNIGDDVAYYGGQIKKGAKRVSDWWFGEGDYEIVSNSLIRGGTKAAMQPLVVSNSRNGGEVRLKFREYLGDVRTHPTIVGAFFLQSYWLNAGNQATFPWFSGIAQQYEQWTPNGIIFEFRSTSTEYSTGVNLGSVIMATDYDPSDQDYTTKYEMLNSAYAQESKTSADVQFHGIECSPASNPQRIFYITAGTTVPTGTSRNEYFLGKFELATQGSAAPVNSIIGSLYINYDITLRKPQMFNGLLARGLLFDFFTLSGVCTNSQWLGDATPTRSPDSNLGGTCVLTTYNFPASVSAGVYRVTFSGIVTLGSNQTYNSPSNFSGTNCSYVAAEVDNNFNLVWGGSLSWTITAGVPSRWNWIGYVRVTASGASFSISGGTWQTNSGAGRLYIEQVNSDELA